MVKIRNLTFEYFDRDNEGNLTDMVNAIRGINFDAKKGEFIAVAGENGSGKSTFARILNRMLVPIEGTVVIAGLDAMDEGNIIPIRKKVGMVFQNPDDQLIGSIVAEDVAFGAENIGIPNKELKKRVHEACEAVGLDENRRINELSGGEKQKVALAGVLAMKPECIVLDEATSMLDPKSRWEILELIKALNEQLGITIIMITHMMDELLLADSIYIMKQGRLSMRGRRDKIFAEPEKLIELGLEAPPIINIRNALVAAGVLRDKYIFSVNEIVDRLKKEHPYKFELNIPMPKNGKTVTQINPVNAILFNDVSFSYGKKQVLSHVSFSVAKGEYVAVVGPTGAGKSTLLSLMNGLLKTKNGNVYVDGLDVGDKATDLRKLRCKIGYVFQYPEQQLFAKNIYEDVVFGPRNIGISEVEAEKRTYEAIARVGLPQDVYDIHFSKLSGGQRRRAALACVLAMEPEYLILDEPFAGLDPKGRQEMLEIIDSLHRVDGKTIILVSHDIEGVASYADRVLNLENGQIVNFSRPEQCFYDMWEREGHIDRLPVIMQLLISLRIAGLPVDCIATDFEKGVSDIINVLR